MYIFKLYMYKDICRIKIYRDYISIYRYTICVYLYRYIYLSSCVYLYIYMYIHVCTLYTQTHTYKIYCSLVVEFSNFSHTHILESLPPKGHINRTWNRTLLFYFNSFLFKFIYFYSSTFNYCSLLPSC